MALEIKKAHLKRRVWWASIGLLAVVTASVFTSWLLYQKLTAPAIVDIPVVVVKLPETQKISSNVLFLGNTYWGRYINDWSMASSLQYTYPFSRLGEFDRAKYDAWITGLECPTVTGVQVSSSVEDDTLQFNCSPSYLPEAAKWFTAFTLANNHTDNQGEEGFVETKLHLDENGIQYFGHYEPRSTGDNCEIISLPVTVTKDDGAVSKGSLPVAMCGYHGVFRIPDADAVAEMAQYSPYMPVIAMPQMGAEYKSEADSIKTDFYRSLIDGGADMVIGDHPHWIQNSESYNGHLIVYSMGNFLFDQQYNTEVTRSAGINVVMNTNGGEASDLDAWLALGPSCSVFKDTCLSEIKSQGLTKLNINYQFGVVGTNDSDRIVKPATPDQQASILQRLNWQSTITGLRPPYASL